MLLDDCSNRLRSKKHLNARYIFVLNNDCALISLINYLRFLVRSFRFNVLAARRGALSLLLLLLVLLFLRLALLLRLLGSLGCLFI